MGVHIVMFASYDPDTITRGILTSDYGAIELNSNHWDERIEIIAHAFSR